MPPIRLIHVSDTHLSRSHAYFQDNWTVFASAIRTTQADLLVHGGDLSFNGPAAEDDLAYASQEIAALGLPWRAVAGNHDIGEAPSFSRLDQPINAARIAAWQRHVGPLWWMHDVGQWRLVGLDTALMGSGLAEEAAQTAFLADALGSRGTRPVMVFVHMPPFDRDPADPARSTSVMPHAARTAFLDTCATGGVRVIACGHLHIYRRMRHRGMAIVWGPATAMVNVRHGMQRYRQLPRPGYLTWELDGTRARHTLVTPERMFIIDMTGWTATNGATTTTLPPLPLRPGLA